MAVERCEECGFDGDAWTGGEAIGAIAALPDQWRRAVSGLTPEQLHRRPLPEMWSIAEYADHVREVLFSLRFLLDTAVAHPGTDLGDSPEPRFDPEPRDIDVERALSGIEHEASALQDRLTEIPEPAWDTSAVVSGIANDVHWIARHSVHDPTHHLLDVGRLREVL